MAPTHALRRSQTNRRGCSVAKQLHLSYLCTDADSNLHANKTKCYKSRTQQDTGSTEALVRIVYRTFP